MTFVVPIFTIIACVKHDSAIEFNKKQTMIVNQRTFNAEQAKLNNSSNLISVTTQQANVIVKLKTSFTQSIAINLSIF